MATRGRNPFSPTFGSTPPLLAGRDDVLARFAEAVDTGPTHPDYTMLVTGDLGTGKTALLNALEAAAAARGWMVISAAASSESVSTRLATEARRCIDRLSGGRRRATVSSVTMMGVGFALKQPSPGIADSSLLSTLEEVGELLAESGTGLLVTVDEFHDVERDDVRDVAGAIQIVTRRRQRPLAFAAAALPLIEHTHLDDPNMTFLQRCARARLGPLDTIDTQRALLQPITDSGSAINHDALAEAVAATLGYPYMIQLVGFHAWRVREDPDEPISVEHVRAGAVEADHAMIDQIARPIWNRLSLMDRRFLAAMLPDDPDSSVADIAERIERSRQYARTYRRRLIAAGAISPTTKSRVRFRHHALRRCTEAASRDDPALSRISRARTRDDPTTVDSPLP